MTFDAKAAAKKALHDPWPAPLTTATMEAVELALLEAYQAGRKSAFEEAADLHRKRFPCPWPQEWEPSFPLQLELKAKECRYK